MDGGSTQPLPGARQVATAFIAVFLFACLVALLRSHALFIRPVLYYEDGSFFAHFYNERGLGRVFWFYNGYVSLVPNLVAYTATLVPAGWAPHIFTGWALIAGALSRALFVLPRFRVLVPSDRGRLVVALLLALWPLGDFTIITAGVYSAWHLLLILLLLALVPVGRFRWSQVLLLLGQVLMICSHPLSVVLVPIWGLRLVRERGRFARVAWAVLIATAVVYELVGVQRGRTWLALLTALDRTGFLVSVRVVLEALLGARVVTAMVNAQLRALAIVLGAAAIGLLVAAVARHRRRLTGPQLELIAVLAYAVFALTFLAVATRLLEAKAGLWQSRYFYVAQFTALLAAMVVVANLGGRWPRWLQSGLVALGVGWCGLLTHLDGYAWWGNMSRDGPTLARFLAQVEAAERDPRAPAERRLSYAHEPTVFELVVRRPGARLDASASASSRGPKARPRFNVRERTSYRLFGPRVFNPGPRDAGAD
jgi:hypothetical protein